MEYSFAEFGSNQNFFVVLIDTCLPNKELKAIKESLSSVAAGDQRR